MGSASKREPAIPIEQSGGREPMMSDKAVEHRFLQLQEVLDRFNRESDYKPEARRFHRLTVAQTRGLYDVEYKGETDVSILKEHNTFQPLATKEQAFEESVTIEFLAELLHHLASPQVAPKLRSFTFRTEAERAPNGTCAYNVDPLAFGDQVFPKLQRLILDQGEGEIGGYKILETDHALNGERHSWDTRHVPGRLLENAPRLKELAIPLLPGPEFFHGTAHPLQVLDVDSAYNHDLWPADFLRNLAGATRFPKLRAVRFTEYGRSFCHWKDWRKDITPFDDYLRFFESPVAAGLKTIILRDVAFDDDEVKRLLAVRRRGVRITRNPHP